jgi:ankyrin repeat protein
MKQLLITIAAVVLVGCGPPKAPEISIHEAAESGNIKAVKQHCDSGTDVNSKALDLREDRRIFNGNSPLFFASTKEVAEMLIANGAKINITYNGFTPLHWAADRGHEEVAALFIEKGLNVNAKDENRGRTPLHFSAHEGHIEATDLLIRKEANLNSLDIDGLTPLDFTNQPNNDVPTRFELNPELLDQNRIVTADLLRKHGGKTGEELKAGGK